MLITDPLFYLIAIPVVLLSGISKTGIPGLFGGMAVPLLSLVISPLQAAAIMLPALCKSPKKFNRLLCVFMHRT